MTEMSTAAQIVNALATPVAPLDSEYGTCVLCGAEPHWDHRDDAEQHEPECPWRMANEYVAAQAAGPLNYIP